MVLVDCAIGFLIDSQANKDSRFFERLDGVIKLIKTADRKYPTNTSKNCVSAKVALKRSSRL